MTALEQIQEWADDALTKCRLQDGKSFTIDNYRAYLRLIRAEAKDAIKNEKSLEPKRREAV